jgi:sigma-E factor negative regulatory protein RseC
MNVRKAVVIRMEGDAAIVKVNAEGGCGRCSESGGCGSDVLGQLFRPSCRAYAAKTDRQFDPGAEVAVSVQHRAPLFAAMLAYGLPLLGLLAGAATGASMFADAGGVVGALLGLSIAGALALAIVRRRGDQLQVSIVDQAEPAP